MRSRELKSVGRHLLHLVFVAGSIPLRYSETRIIRTPRGHAETSVLSELSEKHGKTPRTLVLSIQRLKQTFLRQQDVNNNCSEFKIKNLTLIYHSL